MGKKILAASLVLMLLSELMGAYFIAKADDETYFVVTAYYSPLPDQNNYLRGDYEKEKILNGEGIQGASGKKVFSGMLAAPKSYSFGTKIYLEGVGVGSVEDRGGAIVPAGQRGHKYDRIDIWVGYGDEGLKRALAWGKRTVKGKILDDKASTTTIDIGDFKIPANLVIKNNRYVSGPSIFYTSVGKDSSKAVVLELQKTLKASGLYTGKEDGVYNSSLISSIYEFQKKYDIVTTSDDAGAGYWGIKTRKKFVSLQNSGVFEKKATVSIAQEKNIFDTYIHPKSSKADIIELQKILKEMSLYNGEETGNYSDILGIMISYQMNSQIIKKETDLAAGHFGPKTRAKMKGDYSEYLTKKAQEEAYKALVVKLEKENQAQAQKIIDDLGSVSYGATSENVRELQIILKDLGYFNYQDTAIFGKITKQSVIEYQIDNEIISSEKESVAGLIGPKTRASLRDDLAAMMLEEDLRTLSHTQEVAVK